MADHPFKNVGQGQIGEHPVRGTTRETDGGGIGRPGQVPMGQDGRLGRAGGARGIDQAGHVVELDRLPATRQQAGSVSPELIATTQGAFPGDHPALDLGSIALDQDDALQILELLTHPGHLVEELAILDDQDFRLRVLEQVPDLVGRQGLVNGYGDRADVHDREISNLPLGPVARPESHTVLGLQPLGQQGIRQAAHRPGVLIPADRHPLPPHFEEERGGVGTVLSGLLEERRDGHFQAGDRRQPRIVTPQGRWHAATIGKFCRAISSRRPDTYP